jgi:hypothetical protein
VFIEAQRRRFTTQCPLRTGLVFVFAEELSDAEVRERLRRWDYSDGASMERISEAVRSESGDENVPMALFEIADSVSTTIELGARARVGRCVAIKLLNGGRSAHRVDMSFVRVRGTPGPFAASQEWRAPLRSVLPSAFRPASGVWTRARDVSLVRYMVELAEAHALESAVHLTEGMVLCRMPTGDRYPLLASVDRDELLARVQLIRYFNEQLVRALPWIDLSLGDETRAVLRDATHSIATVGAPSPGVATAASVEAALRVVAESAPVPSKAANVFGDNLRRVRALVLPTCKMALLNSVLDYVAEHQSDTSGQQRYEVSLNRVTATRYRSGTDVQSARLTLFGQTYRQLATAPRSVFLSRQQGWRVFFVGEGGQDVGGLFREQLDELCRELQSVCALQLFVQSANGQHSVGEGRETWLPRASANSPLQLDMFELVGRLIGVALYTNNNLNVDFSSILYKFLVGERANLGDLRAVDAMTVQSLEALRTIDQQGVTEESFEDVFTETFTTNATDGGEVELVPGGKQLRVTAANRDAGRALPPARGVAAAARHPPRPRVRHAAGGALAAHVARAQAARRGPRHRRHRAAQALHRLPQRLLGAPPRRAALLARARLVQRERAPDVPPLRLGPLAPPAAVPVGLADVQARAASTPAPRRNAADGAHMNPILKCCADPRLSIVEVVELSLRASCHAAVAVVVDGARVVDARRAKLLRGARSHKPINRERADRTDVAVGVRLKERSRCAREQAAARGAVARLSAGRQQCRRRRRHRGRRRRRRRRRHHRGLREERRPVGRRDRRGEEHLLRLRLERRRGNRRAALGALRALGRDVRLHLEAVGVAVVLEKPELVRQRAAVQHVDVGVDAARRCDVVDDAAHLAHGLAAEQAVQFGVDDHGPPVPLGELGVAGALALAVARRPMLRRVGVEVAVLVGPLHRADAVDDLGVRLRAAALADVVDRHVERLVDGDDEDVRVERKRALERRAAHVRHRDRLQIGARQR